MDFDMNSETTAWSTCIKTGYILDLNKNDSTKF